MYHYLCWSHKEHYILNMCPSSLEYLLIWRKFQVHSSPLETQKSTPITPRRSPRLALSPISVKPSAVTIKRKRSHHTKTPKAKRRLINDGAEGNTRFGAIISMLEQDLTYNFRTYEGSTYLQITRVEADAGIEQGGLLTGARMIISDMGVACFQADGGPVDYADGDHHQICWLDYCWSWERDGIIAMASPRAHIVIIPQIFATNHNITPRTWCPTMLSGLTVVNAGSTCKGPRKNQSLDYHHARNAMCSSDEFVA